MSYHLGKILEVFSFNSKEIISAENTVQASVLMWDENKLIMDVDSRISDKIKKNDFVLCNYNPKQIGGQAVPVQKITKILPKNSGEKTWKEFMEYHLEKKSTKFGQGMDFNAGQGMIR
jgi:hypothetical protein